MDQTTINFIKALIADAIYWTEAAKNAETEKERDYSIDKFRDIKKTIDMNSISWLHGLIWALENE